MKITKKIESNVGKLLKKRSSNIIVSAITDVEKEEKVKEKTQELIEDIRRKITDDDRIAHITIDMPRRLNEYEKDEVSINNLSTRLYTRPFPGKLQFDVNLFKEIKDIIIEYKEDDRYDYVKTGRNREIYEKKVRQVLNTYKEQPIKLYVSAIVDNISKIRGTVYGFSNLRNYLSYAKSIKSFFTHPLNMAGNVLHFSTYERKNTSFHEDIKEVSYFNDRYKKSPVSPYVFNEEDISYLRYIQETYFNTLSLMANQFN